MEFTPTEAWNYIKSAFFSNDNVDYDIIVRLMDEHFDYLFERGLIDTPLLHEAAHQETYLGSNFILMAAWNSDKWRPLFNDPSYLNKYDEPVWYKIRPQPARIHHQSTPDTNEIRHQIKIAFYDKLSPEEAHKYLYWVVSHNNFDDVDYTKISELMNKHFEYLIARENNNRPLLYQACDRIEAYGSNFILMAAWKSDTWKPMFDSPDYPWGYYYGNRPVWMCLKRFPRDRVITDQRAIRSEIWTAFKPKRKEILQKQRPPFTYDKLWN